MSRPKGIPMSKEQKNLLSKRMKGNDHAKGNPPNSTSFKKGQNSGKNNHSWKGGRKTGIRGYILILTPNHPFCDTQGYVREHRLVMEKHLGRHLLPKEIVHHINEIVADNRIENLELFSCMGEHMKFHNRILSKLRKRDSRGRFI